LEESDPDVHRVPCDSVRPLQNELGSRLPGSGILACSREKNPRGHNEGQADCHDESANDGADRPVDRSSRRGHQVLKPQAQKNEAEENEGCWKPDPCAALTWIGLTHVPEWPPLPLRPLGKLELPD